MHPCHECITRATCLSTIELFDILSKCAIICQHIINDIERGYQEAFSSIWNEGLYRNEAFNPNREETHTCNSLAALELELQRDDLFLDLIEGYGNNIEDFLDGMFTLLADHVDKDLTEFIKEE
jgi:hypothetical protein